MYTAVSNLFPFQIWYASEYNISLPQGLKYEIKSIKNLTGMDLTNEMCGSMPKLIICQNVWIIEGSAN